jgi:hypothetical protein
MFAWTCGATVAFLKSRKLRRRATEIAAGFRPGDGALDRGSASFERGHFTKLFRSRRSIRNFMALMMLMLSLMSRTAHVHAQRGYFNGDFILSGVHGRELATHRPTWSMSRKSCSPMKRKSMFSSAIWFDSSSL